MAAPAPDGSPSDPVDAALERVRMHDVHPVNERNFTIDRHLAVDGIADRDDTDWSIRLLAVRDLVRAGDGAIDDIRAGLRSNDPQVRYVCAMALGILDAQSAVQALEDVVRTDPNDLVRARAVASLGAIGAEESLTLLEETCE